MGGGRGRGRRKGVVFMSHVGTVSFPDLPLGNEITVESLRMRLRQAALGDVLISLPLLALFPVSTPSFLDIIPQ